LAAKDGKRFLVNRYVKPEQRPAVDHPAAGGFRQLIFLGATNYLKGMSVCFEVQPTLGRVAQPSAGTTAQGVPHPSRAFREGWAEV